MLRAGAQQTTAARWPIDAVQGVFRQVMSACLALEQRLRVAYLGPAGTFSHAAVARHFGRFVDAVPCASIDEVFRAAESGRNDFAVVPVENSTEGAVGRTLDLMCATELTICGEVNLRVQQNLLSNAAALDQVKRSLFARAVAFAVRRMAVPSPAGGAPGRRVEQCRSGTARRRRARRGGDRRRDRGVDLRPRDPRAAHRGRAQQHDALLGARPACRGAVGARRRRRSSCPRPTVPAPSMRCSSRSPSTACRCRGSSRALRAPACGNTCSSSISSATGRNPPPRLRWRSSRPSRPFLKLLGSYPAAPS